MARIQVKTGTEGPKHDPYSYTETTFMRTDGRVCVLHLGLAVWVTVDGERRTFNDETADEAIGTFEYFCGASIHTLAKACERLHYTCKKCGCRRTYAADGFPGESLNVCVRCNSIVSSDFCEAAII